MMKKQSIAKIILINFFRTIGVMILLVGVGVLSYYLTMLYLRQNDKTERSTTYTHVIPVNAGTESSNLIYAYNETTRKVEGMVLELFDQDSKNMTYVTIPANTKITISQATYTELLAVNSSIPQVVTMGDLISYFSGDVAYEYGIKVLEGEIGSDIGYFTAMTSQKFQVYYEFATKKKNCFTPTDAYISTLKKCVGEPEMKELIEDMWDDMITDLTLSQKENYAADLSKVNWDYIHAYRISGKEDGDSFVINQKKAKKLINKIWESDAYAESQFDTSSQTEEAADEAQNIEILNGSAIDGLASRYQKMMQADGLSVVNIGNFTGMKQETTTIYARKPKWAKKHLRSYFPKPKKVKVEESTDLEDGIDVMIVLGVDADG